MKELEEMAKEWAEQWLRSTSVSGLGFGASDAIFQASNESFKAGFLACREMAAVEMHPMMRSMLSRSEAAEICRQLGESE